MMGLSQLSKSSSRVGLPVTLSARNRILYCPFGIVVPLAKRGWLIWKRLKPVPSYRSQNKSQ